MQEARLSVPDAWTHVHGVRLVEGGTGLRAVCSPGLGTWRIVGADGAVLGTLHGALLARLPLPGIAVEGDTIAVGAPAHGGPWDAHSFETEVIDRLQGTFLVVTGGPLPRRLYPDTGGTLPVVFCARTRRIGPSAGMILEPGEYRTRLLELRVERLVRREGMGSWIPGTLTAHAGVERLLSNHYLDLDTWKPVRFWPRPEDFRQDMKVETAAATIASHLPPFVAAAAEGFRTGITLTAGYDSRLVLAAARGVAGRIEAFTTMPEVPGIDQAMAARIAHDLGLSHRLVPLLPASEDDMALWDHAVGHAVLEGNRSSGPTLRSLSYDVILTGMFGEPGRSRLYRHDYATVNRLRATPELVLARLARPQDRESLDEVARWLAGIAWLPTSAILDLAHMELKGSGWAMAQHAAQNAAQLEMNPIAQRAIRNAFLAVPPEKKGTEAIFRQSIEMLWPELLAYPVNRYGDWRDQLGRAAKLLQPTRVRRYLRARLS